jgi:hypothetical protein
MSAKAQMVGFDNTFQSGIWPTGAARDVFSSSRRRVSHSLCSALNHFASEGRLGSMKRATNPRTTAGSASRMKSHCHPCSPRAPSNSRSMAESGEPRKLEIGMATMNVATTRARYRAGNQYVR